RGACPGTHHPSPAAGARWDIRPGPRHQSGAKERPPKMPATFSPSPCRIANLFSHYKRLRAWRDAGPRLVAEVFVEQEVRELPDRQAEVLRQERDVLAARLQILEGAGGDVLGEETVAAIALNLGVRVQAVHA